MEQLEQKTMEAYFQEHGIENPDEKMTLITEINQLVYDRNEAIRALEGLADEYKIKQLTTEIEELEGYIQKAMQKNK